MITGKTNNQLTWDMSILKGNVETLDDITPILLDFEPSAGTSANNLDAYINSSTKRLFLFIDSSLVSFDVSIL